MRSAEPQLALIKALLFLSQGSNDTKEPPDLWEMKWGLLKRMDRWTDKEHLLVPEMIDIYKGTPVEKVLLFKEEVGSIFDLSKTEAVAKRDALAQENWWKDCWSLRLKDDGYTS